MMDRGINSVWGTTSGIPSARLGVRNPQDLCPEKRARLTSDTDANQEGGIPENMECGSSGVPSQEPVTKPGASSDTGVNEIPSFDLQFVACDQEALATLDALNSAHQNAEVVLLRSEDGLGRDNLSHRLTISEQGGHQVLPGKLFDHPVPLILVVDIRQMTTEEIATFRGLLDREHPSIYCQQQQQQRPLGPHVKIRILADIGQLEGIGSGANNGPDPDFWSRINHPDNAGAVDRANPEAMEVEPEQLLPDYPPSGTGTEAVTIELHRHHDWRRTLFGGPEVDKQGRVHHRPGALETLQPGQAVILKGANWLDLEFQQQIRSLQARGRYESNGKACSLPDDIRFYQAGVGDQELADLRQAAVKMVTTLPDQPIIINQCTLLAWLNPVKINPLGFTVANTALEEQIAQGGTVTVTAPLSESMWFLLLNRLQTIDSQTGQQPKLFLAHPEQQPQGLQLSQECLATEPARLFSLVRTSVCNRTYSDEQQIPVFLQRCAPDHLVIQITAQTRLEQLFDHLYLQSEQPPRFARSQTPLQQALTEGQAVVILGLETNPVLQQALESLHCPVPSMLVNGTVQEYPLAEIDFLWPKAKPCHTLAWEQSITEWNLQLPELNIWDRAAHQHGLDSSQLPTAALKEMYEIWRRVSSDCYPPIKGVTGLTCDRLDCLIRAARQAQVADGFETLSPKHWRKAIDSTLTHCTRAHPEIRALMKVACQHLFPDPEQQQQQWVDPKRLAQTLGSLKTIDRTTVTDNFWQLARAFGPGVFPPLNWHLGAPDRYQSTVKASDIMYALLACYAPAELREQIVSQLQPNQTLMEQYQCLTQRSSQHRKRLQDALASGWQINRESQPKGHEGIMELADWCYTQSRGAALEPSQQRQLIKDELARSLIWQGAGEAPLATLVDDLLHGRTNQTDKEQRRLKRLQARLAGVPVIFIEGESASGKSHGAARVATLSGPAFITALGPTTDAQDLVQRWVWNEAEGRADRSMERLDQTLRQWAETTVPKDSDQYVTLVLDEAHVAKQGLLDCLKGLWCKSPHIFIDGQPFAVTDKHRVILTGNPAGYGGQHLDSTLLGKIPRVYYPPLERALLQERVVEPALLQQLAPHLLAEDQDWMVAITSVAILALCEHYQHLISDYQVTPGDLADICAWLGWYLRQLNLPAGAVTQSRVNALVWRSCQDVLEAAVGKQQDGAVFALNSWFCARFATDDTLVTQVQSDTLEPAVNQFALVTGALRADVDNTGFAPSRLVQALSQDLLRCQQAWRSGRPHGGRQATLISGPIGQGQEAIVQLTTASIRQLLENSRPVALRTRTEKKVMPEVHSLNAWDCGWETLRHHIREARHGGKILVIQGIDRVASQHLEQELNPKLAGPAAPGFHLFATLPSAENNPPKDLEKALQEHFRYLSIREYSQEQLTDIAKSVLPDTDTARAQAAQLADWHCRLRAALQRQGIPLQPVSRDLRRLACDLAAQGGVQQGDEQGMSELFRRHYWLYLRAAHQEVDTLPAVVGASAESSVFDHSLSQWLNQTLISLPCPWRVRRGSYVYSNVYTHEITVPEHLEEQQAKVAVLRELAQARLHGAGLSPSVPEPATPLIAALYRRWQQHWFNGLYRETGIPGEQVFPLDASERDTLAQETNQAARAMAEQLMAKMGFTVEQNWASCWQQIVDCVETSAPQASAIMGVQVPLPPLKTQAIDTWTEYGERGETERKPCTRVFQDSNYPPHRTRLYVCDLQVTAEGGLALGQLGSGEYGLEKVSPAILPVGDTIPLARKHRYGLTTLTWDQEQWLPLPSSHPQETIVAARTEPETRFEIVKDCYTGLHRIFCPDVRPGERIDFHYLVKYGSTVPGDQRPELAQEFATCPAEIRRELDQLLSEQTLETLPYNQQRLLEKMLFLPVDIILMPTYIERYCESFLQQYDPETDNQLAVLLTERRGRCRHQVAVFVALCRYFDIPARIVANDVHLFAEFSRDKGQSWQTYDPAPETVDFHIVTPEFLATIPAIPVNQKLLQVLRHLDPEQVTVLAEVLGVSREQLIQSIAMGTELPARAIPKPTIDKVVAKLWGEQTSKNAFILGSQLLQSQESLDSQEIEALLGMPSGEGSLLATVANGFIGPDQGAVDRLLHELQLLYRSMTKTNDLASSFWQHAMVEMLIMACDQHGVWQPQVIQLAQAVLAQGWLMPKGNAELLRPHSLLIRLEVVDALKQPVQQVLRQWYTRYPGRVLTASGIRRDYTDSAFPKQQFQGYSSTLETALKTGNRVPAQAVAPGGVTDIERLFTRQDPIAKVGSAGSAHRPVILLAASYWDRTDCDRRAEQLFLIDHPNDRALLEKYEKKQQLGELEQEEIEALDQKKLAEGTLINEPGPFSFGGTLVSTNGMQEYKEIKKKYKALAKAQGCKLTKREQDELDRIFETQGKYRTAVLAAFVDYLYRITNANGGRLTLCWVKDYTYDVPKCGYCVPNTRAEFMEAMLDMHRNRVATDSLNSRYLQDVLNTNNGVIIKQDDLTLITREFLDTLKFEQNPG